MVLFAVYIGDMTAVSQLFKTESVENLLFEVMAIFGSVYGSRFYDRFKRRKILECIDLF